MRRIMLATAGLVGLAAGTPVLAQQAATQTDAANYLCASAGKCGDAPAADTPTRAAPETKGFRVAAPQSAEPTRDAPQTKGFRIASGRQAQPTQAAPATKSFSIARATPAAPARASRGASARRGYVAGTRPAMTPGTGRAPVMPRTDLMLTFDYNSAQMTPAAESKARGFAQALQMPELQGRRFLIEGHTDAKGSRAVNIDLSRKRAQSVADFLAAQGVDRSRIEVKGVGPDEPLPGQPAKSDANRRVEAVLLS